MSTFWKIEEAIGGRMYIVWDGIYSTKEAAERDISRMRVRARRDIDARAVLYETSRAFVGGPVRVEE